MAYSEEEIRTLVQKVLLRTLGPDGVSQAPGSTQNPAGGEMGRAAAGPARRPVADRTITEEDMRDIPRGGELRVPPGAVITPLARDTARERRIDLVVEQDIPPPESRDGLGTRGSSTQKRTIALGADPGGYGMKEDLKRYVSELGYEVVDCGTHSTASVDYPDLAYAVARLVAEGRAWRGIIVDGAGIGSCMAANKVPGVRAALCYDHATALNSREHNDANVLTLGAMLVGPNLARQIVKAWLETDFGGGRHGRRVDKIMGIERRFLRK